MRADDNVGAPIRHILREFLLQLVRRVGILNAAVHGHHHNVGDLARGLHLQFHVVALVHVDDVIFLILGQRDAVGVLGVGQEREGDLVDRQRFDLFIFVAAVISAHTDEPGRFVDQIKRFDQTAALRVEHVVVGDGQHVKAQIGKRFRHDRRRVEARIRGDRTAFGHHRFLIDHGDIRALNGLLQVGVDRREIIAAVARARLRLLIDRLVDEIIAHGKHFYRCRARSGRRCRLGHDGLQLDGIFADRVTGHNNEGNAEHREEHHEHQGKDLPAFQTMHLFRLLLGRLLLFILHHARVVADGVVDILFRLTHVGKAVGQRALGRADDVLNKIRRGGADIAGPLRGSGADFFRLRVGARDGLVRGGVGVRRDDFRLVLGFLNEFFGVSLGSGGDLVFFHHLAGGLFRVRLEGAGFVFRVRDGCLGALFSGEDMLLRLFVGAVDGLARLRVRFVHGLFGNFVCLVNDLVAIAHDIARLTDLLGNAVANPVDTVADLFNIDADLRGESDLLTVIERLFDFFQEIFNIHG